MTKQKWGHILQANNELASGFLKPSITRALFSSGSLRVGQSL